MKAAFKSFGAGFALVLLGFLMAQANVSPFWGGGTVTPGTQGPWLGDTTFNVYNLWLALNRGTGTGYMPALSVSQTSAQANCTQLNNDGFQDIETSSSTGYVCLPIGTAGKRVVVFNNTSQSVSIYANATKALAGTEDTINGTAGSTAYTGLTTKKTTVCYAVNQGVWACGSIS